MLKQFLIVISIVLFTVYCDSHEQCQQVPRVSEVDLSHGDTLTCFQICVPRCMLPPTNTTNPPNTTSTPPPNQNFPSGTCSVLYTPQYFSALCFGHINASNSFFEGRLACGKQLMLQNFTVASNLLVENVTQLCSTNSSSITENITSPLDARAFASSLICGDNADLRSGFIANGFSVTATSSSTFTDVEWNTSCSNLVNSSLPTIDFVFWQSYLLEMSQQYNEKVATGSATLSESKTLILSGNQSFNEYFDLGARMLSEATKLELHVDSSVNVIIINVKDEITPPENTPALEFISINLGDTSNQTSVFATKLVWNFFGITKEIRITNCNLFGSVWALNSTIVSSGSTLTGVLVSDSLTGDISIKIIQNAFCWPVLVNTTIPLPTAPSTTTMAPSTEAPTTQSEPTTEAPQTTMPSQAKRFSKWLKKAF